MEHRYFICDLCGCKIAEGTTVVTMNINEDTVHEVVYPWPTLICGDGIAMQKGIQYHACAVCAKQIKNFIHKLKTKSEE